MGWKVRYSGADVLDATTAGGRYHDMQFEPDAIYDLTPHVATSLMIDYPDMFTRIYPDDEAYHEAAPPPIMQAEPPADLVRVALFPEGEAVLRAVRDATVPGPGNTRVNVHEGDVFRVHPDIAAGISMRVPQVFEVIDPGTTSDT